MLVSMVIGYTKFYLEFYLFYTKINKSSNDISNCFRAVFLNNVSAEQFSRERTRSVFVVNMTFLYFKELFTENVNLSDW